MYLLNRQVTQFVHVGSSSLANSETTHMLYISEFKYNLMPVSKFTKELHCSIAFYPNFIYHRSSPEWY